LVEALYRRAQQTVAEEAPSYLVVAVDPVQFEKPYMRRLEGVSKVYKSRPPGPQGKARLTWGYPAITAVVVNLSRPASTYTRWFSYTTLDFVSQDWEVYQVLSTTRALFPTYRLRLVMDAGGNSQRAFRWIRQLKGEFIIRVGHRERQVQVWNERLRRWESETIDALAGVVLWQGQFKVRFARAGRQEERQVRLGWHRVRLPGEDPPLWLLMVETLHT